MRPERDYLGLPIRSLQTMLRTLSRCAPGLPCPIPDGVFGEVTLEAGHALPAVRRDAHHRSGGQRHMGCHCRRLPERTPLRHAATARPRFPGAGL